MNTNDFIKQLQNISADKRELPLVIECPNGMLVEPKIKMDIENPFTKEQKVKQMVICWR